jgi:hypothetical protein
VAASRARRARRAALGGAATLCAEIALAPVARASSAA